MKSRLMALGAEALADALLKLATCNAAVADEVERMIATPQENVRRFKTKLAGLKRAKRFIHYGESGTFANELSALLSDLRAGVDDPRGGAELLVKFFEADATVFERCDDSSGSIGDIFRYEAAELFAAYAARCDDKKWLANIVFNVIGNDDYGVRDALIECAAAWLPEAAIRDMIARLEQEAAAEASDYRRRHWLHLIESLARQIKDAPLFEKMRLATWGDPGTAACVDIARVYLECGDAGAALSWLERIPAQDTYMSDERDSLLLDIHERLGDEKRRHEIALRIFRRFRSADRLSELLAVLGEEQREAVIADEIAAIHALPSLSLSDAMFMLELQRIDDAERYLLDRAGGIEGHAYWNLAPLAQRMEVEGRAFVATILYRALLESILERAQPKAYAHGADYLHELDRLEQSISVWRDITPHARYVEQLKQLHGRKTAFWLRYRT